MSEQTSVNVEQSNTSKQTANKQTSIKPIQSIFLFTSASVLKRPGTWITYGIFVLLLILLGLIPSFIRSTTDSRYYPTFVASFSSFLPIINILSVSLLGIFKGINIFRDTQRDGFEIILLSKPLTRKDILIGRFLFLLLFGLSVGIINMIIIVIVMAINGMEYYNETGAIIGGSFGGALLGFLMMSSFAIAIGIMGKAGKASTIIPIITLFGSLIITMIMSMGNSIGFIKSTSQRLQERVIKKINDDLKSKRITIKVNGDYNGGLIVIDHFESDNYDSILKAPKDYINWSSSIGGLPPNIVNSFIDLFPDNLYFLDGSLSYTINNYYHRSINVSSLGKQNSFSIQEMITPDGRTLQEIDAQNYFNNTYLKGIFNSMISEAASGTVAISYLNPFSALSNISSLNSDPYSLSSSGNSRISANFAMNNITTKDLKTFFPLIQSSSAWCISYDLAQQDPAWGITLMWLSIIGFLVFLNIYSYLRRDFR